MEIKYAFVLKPLPPHPFLPPDMGTPPPFTPPPPLPQTRAFPFLVLIYLDENYGTSASS